MEKCKIKRVIALLMSCLIFLTACGNDFIFGNNETTSVNESINNSDVTTDEIVPKDNDDITESVSVDLVELNADHVPDYYQPDATDFYSLDDPELLDYIESQVAIDLSNELNPDEYVLKDISVTYVSKEYIEELNYNSKTNIFFGYSLDELDEQFNGTRYVFTLGDDGNTVVTEFQEYDDTYNQILKNVAIGTGVILVFVTVEVVTAGTATPAITYIFAGSATTALEFAVSNAVISGAITTGITAYTTGDWDEALKQGALSASESYKWGSIMGGVSNVGINALTLKLGSLGGLTMDEVALILNEKDLPTAFLKQIKSYEEYEELLLIAEKGGLTIEEMANVCMKTGYPLEIVKLIRTTAEGDIYFEEAGLVATNVGGRMALVGEIDLSYMSELNGELVTNLERMKQGYAAIDPVTGQAYELHHVGQAIDSPLAVLNWEVHRGAGNNTILHDPNIADGTGVHALMSDAEWAAQREQFWIDLAEIVSK